MLGSLFDKYGCDKSKKHRYDTVYEKFFEPIREDALKILEVGVWKGHSMLAHLDYFPNADIYGLDIFTRTRKNEIEPYGLERSHLMKADSTNAAVGPQVHGEFGQIKFDIIIDDGKHTPEANMLTFNHLKPFLAEGGQYFIEDVWPLEKMTLDELGHPWVQRNLKDYNAFKNEQFLQALDRSKMKIERFDLRSVTGEPDSYIIRLT